MVPFLLAIQISRFHPLVVHLPIGILLFAGLLQFLQWRNKGNNFQPTISLALYSSWVASVAAIATGWFLAGEGGYDEDILFWHKWLGIGLTIVLTLICGLRLREKVNASAGLMIFAIALLFATGHFGGSLTHGTDYLFIEPATTTPPITNIEEAAVYSTLIRPILKEKCIGCHNPSKAKGKLVMTTPAQLLAGGETGKALNPDNPLESLLHKRIHLPERDKKHMPPKGKRQLSHDEKVLLDWWLHNQACFDCTVAEMKNRQSVEAILDRYQSTPNQATLPTLDPDQLIALQQMGIPVQPLAADNPWTIVNLAGNKSLDKSTFSALRKIGDHVLELNFQDTNFDDALAKWLKYFPNLQKLQLQNSRISNKSISHLHKLNKLQSLNIYGTNVDDEAIGLLAEFPSLQILYCWQSKITAKGASQLKNALPSLKINHQFDKAMFSGAQLKPPQLLASTTLFRDTVTVRLHTHFKGVTVHYTLDGTDPDSASQVYLDSLIIDTTATLKYYCYKPNWKSSPVKSQYFRKAGLPLKSVQLSQPSHEDYPGKGAATLMDLEQGTNDLKDRRWLAWQGQHLTLTAELDSLQSIQNVGLSALSAPGPWVFYPRGLQAFTSVDGKQYQPAAKQSFDLPQKGIYRAPRYFDLTFSPRPVKFVKLKITSQFKNPQWHSDPGKDAWLFIDELVVDGPQTDD